MSELKNEEINVLSIPVESIIDSPWQLRVVDDDVDSFEELKTTIRNFGLLTKPLVRHYKGQFQLIFGHRRIKALKALGIPEVQVEIRNVSDKDSVTMAIIENVCRIELNHYEKGLAFKLLHEEFHISLPEIGEDFGIKSKQVSRYIETVNLKMEMGPRGPGEENNGLSREEFVEGMKNKITPRHAIILKRFPKSEQIEYAKKTITQDLSVRDLEKMFNERYNPTPIIESAVSQQSVVFEIMRTVELEDPCPSCHGHEFVVEVKKCTCCGNEDFSKTDDLSVVTP